MSRSSCGMVAALLVALLAPASASAAPGALTPVSGPGSCVVATASAGVDDPCAEVRVASSNLDVALSPGGEHGYVTSGDGLAILHRGPDGGLTQPAGAAFCWNKAATPDCTQIEAVPGSPDPAWWFDDQKAPVLTPDGEHLYVIGSEAIYHFTRDLADGTLAFQGCYEENAAGNCQVLQGLVNTTDLAVSPDGAHLYSYADGHAIFTYVVDPATGALAPAAEPCAAESTGTTWTALNCEPWTGGVMGSTAGARALAVSSDGENVYLGGQSGIVSFGRDAATGALTQVDCHREDGASGCADDRLVAHANAIALAADGGHLYATSGDGISAFTRQAGSGALTQQAGAAGCYRGSAGAEGCTTVPVMSAVGAWSYGLGLSDHRGTSLYAATGTDPGTLAVFDRSPAGTLTPLSGTTGCVTGNGAAGCTAWPAFGASRGTVASADGRWLHAIGAGRIFVLERERAAVPDTAAPVITLRTPPAGAARYAQGATVKLDVACTDDVQVTRCAAQHAVGQSGGTLRAIANGAVLDTATLGWHRVRVDAEDEAGNDRSVTHFYEVVAAPPAPVVTSTPAPAAVVSTPDTTRASKPAAQQAVEKLGSAAGSLVAAAPSKVKGGSLLGNGAPVSIVAKQGNLDIKLALSGVVSAGGANVISAGGANVISAGGANVVSAGGANVVSAGGANVVSAGGANLLARGAAKARPKYVTFAKAGRYFKKPGKAKLTLKLTAEGRKLLRRTFRRKGRQTVKLTYIAGITERGAGLPTVVATRTVTIRE